MVGRPVGAAPPVFAMSLRDGAPLPGWPVDVAAALAARGLSFQRARSEPARRACHPRWPGLRPLWRAFRRLRLLSRLGRRHRSAPSRRHRRPGAPARRAAGSGRRAGSPATASLFVATGNTHGARRWSDGEAVFRLAPDLARSGRPQDFFAAVRLARARCARCRSRRHQPAAVGRAGGNCGARPFVLALGKDARAYLLDRGDLGGIGGSLVAETVRPIRSAPRRRPIRPPTGSSSPSRGGARIAPNPATDDALTVLKIRAGSPPVARHRMVRRLERPRFADRHDDRRPHQPDRLDPRRRGRQSAARLSRRHRRAAVRRRRPRRSDDRAASFPGSAGRPATGSMSAPTAGFMPSVSEAAQRPERR